MKNIIITLIAIMLVSTAIAQENKEYNIIDKEGLKQGYWQKQYPNGKLRYVGFFKNDKPIGDLKRYDEYGNLIAEMHYSEKSEKVYTKLYYQGKILQAEGNFINKVKDSTWNYYSIEGFLINKIQYSNNLKNGSELKYYDNGQVYEKSIWTQGIQDGLTMRYYNNGNVMNRISYKNGQLDGEYCLYGLESKIMIQGQYEYNKRNGKWTYYKSSGHIEYEVKYINGVAENQDELDKIENKLIEELEKNKGKFQDPRDGMYNAIPPK